jgi:acyl transferase domain-containing protein
MLRVLMMSNNVVLEAVRVIGLSESHAALMVEHGLTSDLVARTKLASRSPALVPSLKRKCDADVTKLVEKQAKLKAQAAKLDSKPVAPPPGPAPVAPPPAPPAQTVYWYCLNGVPQANQLTMEALTKLGASHYHDGASWQVVSQAAVVKRSAAPKVDGSAIPFPRSVKLNEKNELWVNLSGVSKFGGAKLECLQALLTDESHRAAFLAELDRLLAELS